MLALTTEVHLIALHTGVVKESLHIEYKASDAIDKKSDKKKLEMARDISAFANADGGQVIYGMKENENHEPDGLDDGLDPREYPEIWFDQILQQHVTPKLVGVKPRHIPLSNGRVAIVVDIPATSGDPHQVDGRYYRRHNFNRLIMEHYEVKQAFAKQSNPELYVEAQLLSNRIAFSQGVKYSGPVTINFVIANRSNTPAMYVLADINVSPQLKITSTGDFVGPVTHQTSDGKTWEFYTRKIEPSSHFPIFRESPFNLSERAFHVAFPPLGPGASQYYPMTVILRCPGFRAQQRWRLRQLNNEVTIEEIAVAEAH